MFQGLSGVLLQQERNHVSSTLDTVISRVDNLQGHFTASSVNSALQPNLNQPSGAISEKANIYQNSVITDLSRDSTGVSVYNAQKKEIFNSRNTHLDNNQLTKKRETKMRKTGHFDGLVGQAPIYAQDSHRLLGYVQVTNAMTEYKAARNRFTFILIVLVISAVFVASIFSYCLADLLLKPITGLTKQCAQCVRIRSLMSG